MTESTLHPMPRLRDVLLEQLRATGLALRTQIIALIALLSLATVLVVIFDLRQGDVIDFHPERWMLPGVAGLLLPIAIWKAEQRFGPGFLWTLPVDRRSHALAKVFAGWIWLMAAVAVFFLWLLGLTLLSGGAILGEEAIWLLPATEMFSPAPPGAIELEALRTFRLLPNPLYWLIPFTGATGTYLLASALALGSRHILRWIVAIVLGVMFIAVIGDLTEAEWLIFLPSSLLRAFLSGPFGLDTLLTARTEFLKTEALLTSGERIVVWRGLPDFAQWVNATLLWTGLGLAALWAAASRHREDRRP